jgi:hypothetical protein
MFHGFNGRHLFELVEYNHSPVTPAVNEELDSVRLAITPAILAVIHERLQSLRSSSDNGDVTEEQKQAVATGT